MSSRRAIRQLVARRELEQARLPRPAGAARLAARAERRRTTTQPRLAAARPVELTGPQFERLPGQPRWTTLWPNAEQGEATRERALTQTTTKSEWERQEIEATIERARLIAEATRALGKLPG